MYKPNPKVFETALGPGQGAGAGTWPRAAFTTSCQPRRRGLGHGLDQPPVEGRGPSRWRPTPLGPSPAWPSSRLQSANRPPRVPCPAPTSKSARRRCTSPPRTSRCSPLPSARTCTATTFTWRSKWKRKWGEDGLAFDYNIVKDGPSRRSATGLDERTLLPERSPHLRIERGGDYVVALFNGERIPFLPRDVRTLPVANITVEALAAWFLEQLKADPAIKALDIHRLVAKVSSGPGQWARAEG